MECKNAEKMVLPYLRNELSDEETAAFIEHVKSCPSCFDELEIYFTIQNALRTIDDENVNYDIGRMIEADFETRLAAIRKKKRKKILQRLIVFLGVLFLAGLIYAILNPEMIVELFYRIVSLLPFARTQM